MRGTHKNFEWTLTKSMFPLRFVFVFLTVKWAAMRARLQNGLVWASVRFTTGLTWDNFYTWENECFAIWDWVRAEEELKTNKWTWSQEENQASQGLNPRKPGHQGTGGSEDKTGAKVTTASLVGFMWGSTACRMGDVEEGERPSVSSDLESTC